MLQEAFRVLKLRGRFAVSDVVVRGELPAAIRKSMELWIGCIAGALFKRDYVEKLERAKSYRYRHRSDTRLRRRRSVRVPG